MGVLRALLVLVLPTCLLVLVAPPAAACSCVGGDTGEHLGWADTAFAGTLTAIVPAPDRLVVSSNDPVAYEFEVETVYAGEAHETTSVRSARFGASCGLEGMAIGREYVVFAVHQDHEGEPTDWLWANLCGGTAPASDRLLHDVERAAGPGRAPHPGESPGPQSLVDRLLTLGGVAAATGLASVAIGVAGLLQVLLSAEPR